MAVSHLPCLVWTLWLFSLIWTQITGVKPPPNSQTLVRQKEVISVLIKLNHGSDHFECDFFFYYYYFGGGSSDRSSGRLSPEMEKGKNNTNIMSHGNTRGEEETKCLIIVIATAKLICSLIFLGLFKLRLKATRWIDNKPTSDAHPSTNQ